MNKFCVGQKVIDCFNDRKLLTVVKTFESGQIELENGVITYTDRVQRQEHYLDHTNYLYHHSRFGDAVCMINEAFQEYISGLAEMGDLCSYPGESVFIMKARTMCQAWIDDAAAKIEHGLAWKRTAEYNLSQWHRVPLDHHFPFLNPENVTDY